MACAKRSRWWCRRRRCHWFGGGALSSCAHVLEGVFEFDFLATVTPSWVMVEAGLRSSETLRPLGPRGGDSVGKMSIPFLVAGAIFGKSSCLLP